ncbi:hypothetical protein [Neorhizobium sp. DAR64872/K0K18]|uniref:hypothetical protein n=1 Tax=Neorhizobium sp. DAR64872/K0K18 TaxID=3421958 RepID=UPI003D2DDC49
MHLIQILLPTSGGKAAPLLLDQVREELTEKFGGLTFHRSAPAQGLWEDGGDVQEDDIVVAEVMADELDPEWWLVYRRELERRFRQDEIVIRALSATRL